MGKASDDGTALTFEDPYHPQIAKWMLRALLRWNPAFRRFYRGDGKFNDDEIAAFLGLVDIGGDDAARQAMRRALACCERHRNRPTSLRRNLDMLGGRLGLSALECELIEVAVLQRNDDLLDEFFSLMSLTNATRLHMLLAKMLGVARRDVALLLHPAGRLARSGLLSVLRYHRGAELGMRRSLAEALIAENRSEADLMGYFLRPSGAPTLAEADFGHVAEDLRIMQGLLVSALADTSVSGVNVLIYGPPGTGKTEIARLLARKTGAELFEVSSVSHDGEALRGNERFDAYCLAQGLLASAPRALVLFDEIEDVFPTRSNFFGMEMHTGGGKAWINRMLEENPRPAIWISNDIRQIDPAYLRRFDYVCELANPPRESRLRIVRKHLDGTAVGEGCMRLLADQDGLSPAALARAGRMLRRLRLQDREAAEAAVLRMLDNSLRACARKPLQRQPEPATAYRPELVNVDIDLDALLDGLRRTGRGCICFYGPPGTGKSALAAHIAERLQRPLLRRRASDILSCWVGETERNIAAMFRDAAREGAVLLLDEADSFLRDRRGAHRSWEVTQVNELIVQMETFDRLFICSTNLMDDLDPASLRRFAIKIRFDYLTPAQARGMLRQECTGEVSESHLRDIAGMKMLTPGDFAAVKKRLAILGCSPTADALLDGLREEVGFRQSAGGGPIGFV